MVCLGNICRSPLAEGIMREKIRQHELDWEVDSAGTSNWHAGEAPDERSVEVAEKYGIDITEQRGRQFSPYDLEQFDRIYAMDSENYSNILRLTQTTEEKEKIRLILNELYPGKNMPVPDPYWDDDGFEQVFQMLDEACDAIIKNAEL